MRVVEIVTKLDALKERAKWLKSHYWNSKIPASTIKVILDQLTPTMEALREKFPHMLEGFEGHNFEAYRYVSDYKPEENGKFYQTDVASYIIGDIDYYLGIIPPPPKVAADPLATLKVTKEGMFLSGQYFDAFLKMSEIIGTATKEVIVIDGWIDEKLLSLFTNFEGKVKVKILTFKIKQSFQPFIDDFNKQYNNSLEVKINQDFHDRFIIIDETEFYHIGASIKDAGNRGFMFSQIEEPMIKKMLLDEFKAKW